jgi:hemerythrin superfamily protein
MAGLAAVGFLAGLAMPHLRKLAMQGGEALLTRGGDWFDVIKLEHRAVEKSLDVLVSTDDHETGKRQALLTKIAYSLNKHAVQEENAIYPALRAKDADAAMHLVEDHADIKTLIAELQYELAKDDPQWIARARQLRDAVVTHAREEEETILLNFHNSMSEEENADISRRLNWEGAKVA